MGQKVAITVGGVALGLGLGACGGTMPPAEPMSDPQQVGAMISQDLGKLRSLQIVDVGQLVLQLPESATACYGLPCPGSGGQAAYDAERARQGARLDKLTTIAEAAALNQYLPPHEASEADAAVRALADLQIVEVGGLVVSVPANNPSCYSLPCPSDREAADAENARRVTIAFGIADAARRDGI